VSDFSRELIGRSGYEREGFAEVYDEHRPSPAAAVIDVLLFLAQTERPGLVIDLGAGTGLSTRVWAERADEVVGVDANARMIERAHRMTRGANIRFVEGFAAATGLPAGQADIVTCSQSFHWMEPEPVLAEAARLLRAGGIFAAYDYDVPPVIQPDVDEAFRELLATRDAAWKRVGPVAGQRIWPKERHLARIQASSRFRITRELVCHGWEEANATRVAGLARSLGGAEKLFGDAAPEVSDAYERLVESAKRILGERKRPMLLCFRIRAGIK
jgi:ubiquinone/menaquinone biosynthesis C-methylase UbiE